MKTPPALAVCLFTLALLSSAAATQPYQVLNIAKVGGAGGFDYVYADSDGRRLYIPRGNRVTVYDLDTLKSAGEIPNTPNVHGVAVDPQSHHGFSSSRPVVMWDTQTLATLKTIAVEGAPDAIHFDPATGRILVLSHRTPNVTVLDAKDGSLVGTLELGGAPEQAVSDGTGRVFIDIEDKDEVAVVDARVLQVTARYSLGGKGGTPAGLAIDAKNHLLFACCREPATCVILNADDGKILASLPIGAGTDSAAFNPSTMEAFSSQRDGTLTVIKENRPTSFVVEQDVQTMPTAKTCTLDPKTNHILLIAEERTAPPAAPATPPADGKGGAKGKGGRGGRGQSVPDSFTILVVGR